MFPAFNHPAAFWMLLGVPALLAIHCLQQRTRKVTISTLFLLEQLAPESRGGRSWDWLRNSRQLWLQLLAVLLATWVLAEPRWLRYESSQTIVAILDSAARMDAFRDEATRAADDKFSAAADRATRTDWVVLSSDPRQPPLYRGPDRAAAEAALAAWRPRLGTHDYAPAMRLGRELAGANGLVWFITDSRAKRPPDQPAAGVGRPLENVGFASVSMTRIAGVPGWRALVQNHASTPQHRTWWIETVGGAGPPTRSPEQPVDLAPGALVELDGAFGAGTTATQEAMLVLSGDGFALDDRLPLVLAQPKALPARVEATGEIGDFYRKVLGDIDGVRWEPIGPAPLRVVREGTVATAPGAAIVLPATAPETGTASVTLLRAPVVAEHHALVADLNWQGWLGTGPKAIKQGPDDVTLLWQNDAPLAWLRPGPERTRQLVLDFDWETSNAARLPATVLLARRFAETVRDAQPGFYAANFDTGSPIPLAEADRTSPGAVTMEFRSAADPTGPAQARPVPPAELEVLRAPGEAGFFILRRGDTVLVHGAVQFADTRQGDFSDAETFDTGLPPEAAAALQHNTLPDPLTNLWLVTLGLLLLGSWLPSRRPA
jgi:hypothetical protein